MSLELQDPLDGDFVLIRADEPVEPGTGATPSGAELRCVRPSHPRVTPLGPFPESVASRASHSSSSSRSPFCSRDGWAVGSGVVGWAGDRCWRTEHEEPGVLAAAGSQAGGKRNRL